MTNQKFDTFLKGKLVDLAALNEGTVENTNWYNWFNEEDNTKYMQKHYFPNTKAKQLQFYKDEIENNGTKLQLGIVHKKDSMLIGIISLNNIDFLNRKCEIAGFIGESKYQNFKLFIEANNLLLKHAFDSLNMHKIYGGALRKEVCLMFCRVFGFKEEGIQRKEIYKNGEYHDAYTFGLLREEYYTKNKVK